ncbi:MAG: DUF4399 domain-containing protein [Gemmatimonadaceae bacterium]|nr:DUF4399 domain-containing protein [Gemmatimonadaceae bacterium]
MRAVSKGVVVVVLSLGGLSIRAEGQAAATPAAAQPAPEIFIREPRSGATVPSTFTVVFGLRNYGVAPAGANFPRTGHFHLLIDGAPVPPVGTVVPADSVNRHYGSGVIETKLTLAPGRHRLRAVLADHEHKVIGPELVSKEITITVRR